MEKDNIIVEVGKGNYIDTPFPSHWFIKEAARIFWHLPVGIYSDWNDMQRCSLIYGAYVYLCLLDIPEAKYEIERCHAEFMRIVAPDVLNFADVQMKSAKSHHQLLSNAETKGVFATETRSSQLVNIFQPWIDRWAIGSQQMMKLVIGASTIEAVFPFLGLKRRDFRTGKGKPTKKLLEFATSLDPDTREAWQALLSGVTRKGEAALRDYYKVVVRSNNYNQKRERDLIVATQCWIAVRVFRYTEDDLFEIMCANNVGGNLEKSNLSKDIFKPIDLSLGYDRSKTGRPPGKKSMIKPVVSKSFTRMNS